MAAGAAAAAVAPPAIISLSFFRRPSSRSLSVVLLTSAAPSFRPNAASTCRMHRTFEHKTLPQGDVTQ